MVLAIGLILAYGSCGSASPRGVQASNGIHLDDLKKTCHKVAKKVHGKSKRVKVCSKAAAPTPTPTATPGPQVLGHPGAAAVDSSGNLLVVDNDARQVIKLSPDGQVLTRWPVPQDTTLQRGPFMNGIGIDRQGSIYVTDGLGYRIVKFAPTGAVIGSWDVPSKRLPPSGFSPESIAFDAAGNVYTADFALSQIDTFSPSGVLLSTFGRECTHPDRTVFVCLPENKIPPGVFNHPIGVSVDTQGNIYVCDHRSGRIVKLSSSWQQLAVFGPKLPGNYGSLDVPEGIAVDSQGDIYVNDGRTTLRVVKLSPNGQPLGQWIAPSPYKPIGPDALDAHGNVYVPMQGDAVHPDFLAKLSPDLKLVAQWWGTTES
jgi:sugar lactone lactonase YvrE